MKSTAMLLCLRPPSVHAGKEDTKALENGSLHVGITASILFLREAA